jgi:hypothetical protein
LSEKKRHATTVSELGKVALQGKNALWQQNALATPNKVNLVYLDVSDLY